MGALLEKIQSDLQSAMKARRTAELEALRLLKSDLQYEMNKTGVRDLDDEKVLAVIKTACKKRKDSIAEFERANRPELLQKEKDEYEILSKYLPAAISEAEVKAVLDEVWLEVKPATAAESGKVIGKVMARLKGQNVDGALVKKLVQERF
ncbi:MAG: GatB/YqeY domain-containing protein [Spirochaetales bacterium]|nr:GatB/YqeY domain-containing protein [Spirochaetales bacterium]